MDTREIVGIAIKALPLFFMIVGAIVFVLIRNKEKTIDSAKSPNKSYSRISIFILSGGSLLLDIITVQIMRNYYGPHRPVSYFILMTLIVVIGIFILLYNHFNSNAHRLLVLGTLIISSLIFRASVFYLYPGLIGIDPWIHYEFISKIITSGSIPILPNFAYSNAPVAHIFIVTISIIGQVSLKDSIFIFSPLEFVILSLTYIYIIGNRLFNKEASAIALVLILISDILIRESIWFRPNVFSSVLFLMSVTLIITKTHNDVIKYYVLIGILSFAVMLSHLIISVVMLIFIAIYWGTSTLTLEQSHFRNNTKTFIISYIIAMIALWSYKVNFAFYKIFKLISLKFNIGLSMSSGTSPLVQRYPIEYILDTLSPNISVSLFTVGVLITMITSLKLLSNTNKRVSGDVTSYITYLMFVLLLSGLIGVSMILGLSGLYPARLYPVYYTLSSVFIALAILKIRDRKIALITLLMVIVFFSITDSISNIDSPIYSKHLTFRYSYTFPELNAIHATKKLVPPNIHIVGDSYYYLTAPVSNKCDFSRVLLSSSTCRGATQDINKYYKGNVLILRKIYPIYIKYYGNFIPKYNYDKCFRMYLSDVYSSEGVDMFKI